MTRILVFYPSNSRTIQLETTILALHRVAEVELLTTCPEGPLHEALRQHGIHAHSHPVRKGGSSVLYYLRQIFFLVGYCRRRRITAVFSNLQHANFIAVFAQFFISARVVLFRHHFKFILPGDDIPLRVDRMERLFDRVINRLARTTVVPSRGVYDGMRAMERTGSGELIVLPYIYDFSQYDCPDPESVSQIRATYPAELTLLMVGRLIPFKRPLLVFEAVMDVVGEGLDVRLLVLGDGPERRSLEAFVQRHHMEDRIVILGQRSDVADFMAASDLLVHPSLTEASSSAVKEMALQGSPSLVCQGVGDFDSYVKHGKSGLVVARTLTSTQIGQVIKEAYVDQGSLRTMGAAARELVLDLFSETPDRVARYLELAG